MNPLSVAPMMDRTDRHFRWIMRQISPSTLLYTEMVTVGAVLHGDRDYLLGFHPVETPLALQLGGDDPTQLAECAKIAQDRGYDEVNLNVGCPSSRVQSGSFGACLMRTPGRVADAVAAMQAVVDIEVTVKHRIGVDELDRYEDMCAFVERVATSGCRRFSVHARKAWLQGLSPKENRTVPPLRYDDVYRLKKAFPHLDIEINGGVVDTAAVLEHLQHVDGVMIGRGAYDRPMWFADLEQAVFQRTSPHPSPFQVAELLIPYVESFEATGQPAHRVLRHALNLFAGVPGARAWKRALTGTKERHGRTCIEAGLQAVREVQGRGRMSA